jgi:hypothetical protein
MSVHSLGRILLGHLVSDVIELTHHRAGNYYYRSESQMLLEDIYRMLRRSPQQLLGTPPYS